MTVFALGGGDPPADADVDLDEGAVQATATACPPEGTPAVCIGEVTLDPDGRLLATFTTHDVNLVAPTGGVVPDGTVHAMFFFDSIDPIDPSGGRVWGPSSPFGDADASLPGFSGTDAPGASQALCVLIQDDRGRVFDGTGNCAPLPAGV